LLVVAVPPMLVALIVEPETTPAGTVTTTLFALKMLNGALTPPIAIAETEPKLVPVNVIVEPTSLTNDAAIVIVGFDVVVELALNVLDEAVPPVFVTRKTPF